MKSLIGIALVAVVTVHHLTTVATTLAFAPPRCHHQARAVRTTATKYGAAAAPSWKSARPTTTPSWSYNKGSNNGRLQQLRAEPTSEQPQQEETSKLPFFLDPGTKGGAVFLSFLLFAIPIVFYNIILSVFSDVDALDLGRWIGVGFTVVVTLAWLSTYLFRVATKDMTYVSSIRRRLRRCS